MNEEKTKEMDELINCLDDLPHLMDKIKAETANTTRYSITGPNYSYSVGMALNGQDPKERNAYQMQRMAFQAKKVLERLSALPKSTSINKKTVQDNARTAKETLLKYKKSGIDLKSFYKQYDTTRSGNLTYKDFSDILLSMSTGIGREDAMFLARSMDKNKTGYLNYNKILDSLEQVEKSEKTMKVPGASSTAPSDKTPLSIEAYSYSNRDDVSRPFTESKSAEVSPAGSVASQKRVTFIDENNANETQRMMKRIISLDPSNSKVDTHPEAPVESPQDILNREFGSTGRRFFWNNPQTAVTRRMKEREAPYYVEMTLDEKKEIKKKRRSSSAPPRASSTSAPSSPASKKALSVYLRSQDDNIDVESSEEVPEITPTNRASLKNVLNRNNSTDSLTRASKEDSGSGLKLHNPVTETRTILTERHQLIEETEKTVLENNLIRQIGGKYENLKHIMKNQDHSKSGTINLQEFKRSLTRLGVQLNQHQMDSLFANYLTQTSADETNRRLTPKEHFIYNDQSNQSFFNTSSINISDKEKVIPIDTVLERLQQRAKAHAFEHIRKDINVQGEKLDIFLQENEKLKISKKILNQMNRTPNPNRIFESLYPSNHGFLTPSQLTKSLQTMGTDIQSKEIETIVNELPKGPKGEISLQQFHQSLIKQTQEIMQKTDQRKKEHYNINNHPRYGATYRSNIQLGESGNEYYNNNKNDIISQTKLNNGDSNSLLSQKEKKEWSKLQNHLQRSYPKILKVFSDKEILQSLGKNENLEKQNQISNTIEEQYLQPITVEQLQKRLSKEGIHLGQDDTERLQKQIYSKLYQENRLRNSLTSSLSSSFDDGKKNNTEITMDDFCEVVGIPIRRYDNTNRVELMDKHESKVSDVGVFESSKNSVHHNATSTTSIFFENDDTVRERYFGKQTRKPPLPLSVYSKDPSKFWDMPKSNDNPMAFPYPLPSTRPSAPFQSANTSTTLAKINEKGIRRGIVSLNEKPQALAGGGGPKLTMEALLKANNQPLSRVVTNDGSFVIKGGSGSSGVLIGGGGGTSANYAENPLRNSHAVNTSQSTILNESSNLVINDDSMAVDASHLTAPSNMSPFVTPTDVGRHRRGRGRRSSSAPPRSGSNHSQGGYSNDEYDGYSSNTGSIASATSSARSDRGGNVNSRRINADELSQHIAKWSNNTLADYYNKALSTGTGPAVLVTGGAKTVSSKGKSVDHYDSQDSTISPSSYHSASTISRGTVNFNKKPVAIMGGGGKKSVRDDFDSSAAVATMKTGAAAAPFANDLQR